MQIFLAGSLYGKDQSQALYQKIVDEVTSQGHTILADHLLSTNPEEMKTWSLEQDLAYHSHIIENIKKADAMFAEVSYPSTSVGYLMSLAIQAGKPTVAFYNGTNEPHLFRSLERLTDKLQVSRYSSQPELRQEVRYALEFISTNQDVRFNFFISPELASYMDWISRNRKIPRSVYLRRLIDDDMARQPEYEEYQLS